MKKPLLVGWVIISLMALTGFSWTRKPAVSGTLVGSGPVEVPRNGGEIRIDGKLTPGEWEQALHLELEYETNPGENIPAPVRTQARVTYDDSNLYIALLCHDPDPASIRARYSDRDRIIGDDLVHVNLDTFNDERRNYFFGVNALGIQRDGIESRHADETWDAIWESSCQLVEQGYSIEMAIPFSSLQFPRTAGEQIWGLDISRLYPRSKNQRLGLVPINRNNDNYQSQFLKIRGFSGIKPGRNVEINPTMTAVRTSSRNELPDGPFDSVENRFDPGVTARWGITNNMMINATVNPDFSQVEADSRQLDINQTFALFFPEKRPFFTEGIDFFETPMDVIHTRTVQDPIWGMKLTGKEGPHTVGAYLVQDGVTNLLFPGSQGSNMTMVDASSTALVARYKWDIGYNYTLGAVATNRQGQDYYNRVGGLDAEIRLSETDRITSQVIGSTTRYPGYVSTNFAQPEGTFTGNAINVQYQHFARNWSWWSTYERLDEGFRSDLGFVPRVGYSFVRGGSDYTWHAKPGKWWSRVISGGSYDRMLENEGGLLTSNFSYWFVFTGARQSFFHFRGHVRQETYNGMLFDMKRWTYTARIQPTANLQLRLNIRHGGQIDYAHTRPGVMRRLQPFVEYKLGRHISLNFNHLYEQLRVNSNRLYTANISQGTVKYQFNERMFFRVLAQYVNYDYNTDMYVEPRDSRYENLFSQWLFSYKINPRTMFFLGYSDNYFGNQEYGLVQSGRTFFTKLGYAWQW